MTKHWYFIVLALVALYSISSVSLRFTPMGLTILALTGFAAYLLHKGTQR